MYMSVSAKIKALLTLQGQKQAGLMDTLDMSSKQSLRDRKSVV